MELACSLVHQIRARPQLSIVGPGTCVTALGDCLAPPQCPLKLFCHLPHMSPCSFHMSLPQSHPALRHALYRSPSTPVQIQTETLVRSLTASTLLLKHIQSYNMLSQLALNQGVRVQTMPQAAANRAVQKGIFLGRTALTQHGRHQQQAKVTGPLSQPFLSLMCPSTTTGAMCAVSQRLKTRA